MRAEPAVAQDLAAGCGDAGAAGWAVCHGAAGRPAGTARRAAACGCACGRGATTGAAGAGTACCGAGWGAAAAGARRASSCGVAAAGAAATGAAGAAADPMATALLPASSASMRSASASSVRSPSGPHHARTARSRTTGAGSWTSSARPSHRPSTCSMRAKRSGPNKRQLIGQLDAAPKRSRQGPHRRPPSSSRTGCARAAPSSRANCVRSEPDSTNSAIQRKHAAASRAPTARTMLRHVVGVRRRQACAPPRPA